MIKKALIFLLMLCVASASVDIDAHSKRRRSRKSRRPKVTKVVMKTPTAFGPLDETEPFVEFERPEQFSRGLDNRVIALWQSHGKYYDQKTSRWKWQRPRLFGTVEDLFTQGFVMPYLMPMLENAGAYVLSPRERDLSEMEIIVDTDGSSAGDFYLTESQRSWVEGPHGSGFAMPRSVLRLGDNPFAMGTSETVGCVAVGSEGISTAAWCADIPKRGRYAVYVSYRSFPNSAPDARYTVHHLGGDTHVRVNQRMGSGTWIYLGHYDLPEGKMKQPVVELTNESDFFADGVVVSADAVKIGGGMGNVARKPHGSSSEWEEVSGAPRWHEGARYWLQWAGMPVEVYSESKDENDYTDDYKARALWVNYLAGGSPMLPDSVGLGVPIDLAFAFHSDAGTTDDGSVVGTLGIYSLDDGNLLGDGRSRTACGELTEMVISQVGSDLHRLHNPTWNVRGIRDKKYYEIRATKVPAMIMEILSHQNFDDMKYGLDPVFRHDVSRAVYKGILRFLSQRYHRPYAVQPLAPGGFAIHAVTPRRFRLSWRETPDSLEPTASAKGFIVEERIGNGAFHRVASVTEPVWEVEINDKEIHSYRIVAYNDGGYSFPSEVLALYTNGHTYPEVNIVNGFTRLSGPDSFQTEEYGGFNALSDGGVPDKYDIITTGLQYDFNNEAEFVDNDRGGFGASAADLERTVITGNSFDYPFLHGVAIKHAGHGFVSQSVESFINELGIFRPNSPKVVDLILGKQKEIAPGQGWKGTRYKAFPRPLQNRIEDHLSGGGALMVSGAYVASDLLNNSYSDEFTAAADSVFTNTRLGVGLVLGKGTATGQVMSVASQLKPFDADEKIQINTLSFNSPCYIVESPDAIAAVGSGASVILRYVDTTLPAAVAVDRKYNEQADDSRRYKAVTLGFPFEVITDPNHRNWLMKDILNYLSK